jgi:GDP-D-mannose 3',5'-epimerase
MASNTRIDLNVLEACVRARVGRIFYASSACVYPAGYDMPRGLRETDAWPAWPQNAFGLQKLYAERLFEAHDIELRVGRLHQVYGPGAEWREPRAKVVASLCRRIATLPDEGGDVPIWGDGSQRRSFTFISDAVDGIVRLMRSDVRGPVNLGDEQAVSVTQVAHLIAAGARKAIRLVPTIGPVGAHVRLCDGTIARERLGWSPTMSLAGGLNTTYAWVEQQVLAERG